MNLVSMYIATRYTANRIRALFLLLNKEVHIVYLYKYIRGYVIVTFTIVILGDVQYCFHIMSAHP